jgi:hypothetical protein
VPPYITDPTGTLARWQVDEGQFNDQERDLASKGLLGPAAITHYGTNPAWRSLQTAPTALGSGRGVVWLVELTLRVHFDSCVPCIRQIRSIISFCLCPPSSSLRPAGVDTASVFVHGSGSHQGAAQDLTHALGYFVTNVVKGRKLLRHAVVRQERATISHAQK